MAVGEPSEAGAREVGLQTMRATMLSWEDGRTASALCAHFNIRASDVRKAHWRILTSQFSMVALRIVRKLTRLTASLGSSAAIA